MPTSSGRGKTVAFGDATMSDYTIHKDKARRERYRTRHQNDRIDDPYAPGFWSWWSLWGESSDLAKAHADAVKRAKKILGVKKDTEGNEVARKNPPLMGEAAQVITAYNVPTHLHAEFLRGLAVEWEKAPSTDLHTLGRVVLDHLGEDAHHYRRARRARARVSPRVQACFDALLSLVQEQYPSLACAVEVDEAAGERDGKACARAFAFCEDHGEGGAFRIAIAGKMNDPDLADDSRVEGILRHELAHAVLLHGGDTEHTERDADEVAEALFGSPIFYDEDDVQTTDPSAPGARRPRPEYLDDEQGRTLDTPRTNPYPTDTMQLHTVEDVASCLDDCAAQGDAKTPRMLASQLSQQAKEVAGAKSRMILTLAKAARHCANGIEARLAGEVDRAMTSERMCDAALQEAAAPPRRNPMDSYELILDGLVPTTPAEKARLRRGARKYDLDVHHVGGWEWAFTGSKDNLQKYLSSMIDDAEEVEGHLRRARAVGSRGNPEWAKKLGSGLYKGARYSAETARDVYKGAREAHAARSAAAPIEGERKNPHPGFDQYEFRVSSSFLPALFNGDVSGLSAEDEAALDRFLARAMKLGHGHWAVIEEDAGFGRDEITGLGSDRALIAWMVPRGRKNPRPRHAAGATHTHRLPGIGTLTVRPDPEGGRDVARVEVTKAFTSEWDHDMLNHAYLSRDVMDAVEKYRHGSNFYAVDLVYRGRAFTRLYPRGSGV